METELLWHNGRRGDKQTWGQQFESHTHLEVNSSVDAWVFCKINAKITAKIYKIYAKFNANYVRSTLNSTLNM